MTRGNLLNSAAAASGVAVFVLTVSAQEIDSNSIEKIKDEGMNRSQVMEIASYLTDVHGPRLSGSPGTKAAGDWAVSRMKEWGLTGVALEHGAQQLARDYLCFTCVEARREDIATFELRARSRAQESGFFRTRD